MNYEEDIKIDETALDVEWLGQPKLMLRYAQHAAKMRMETDIAKEKLDIMRAELDKEVRMNPDSFDIAKITEATVLAAIISDSRYQKANKAYLEAKYESDIAQSAVRAFDARKDALENLVRLHGQQYFAGPKMPRDLSFEVRQAESTRSANSAIKSRMARKTRREDDDN
jgi:hypothetical protein